MLSYSLKRALLIGGLLISPLQLAVAQDPFRIHAIQGNGTVSPLKGERVKTEGILTGFFTKGKEKPFGFYLQEPTDREDGHDETSEGIFVHYPKDWSGVKQNDLVRVIGTIREFYAETQIADIESTEIVTPATRHNMKVSVPEIPAELPFQSKEMERYEGMSVQADGVVTRSYGFDYAAKRNNMVMAKSLQYKPSQQHRHNTDEATAMAKSNSENRIVLEEPVKQINGEISYYPHFNPQTYPLRVGSELTDIKGIVAYAYSKYFLVVNAPWSDASVRETDDPAMKRVAKPAARKHSDDIRVAGFNLLNFFTDAMVEGAPQTQYAGGNRGAKTPSQGVLQRQKLAETIRLMDADAIGFLEVGNNGHQSKSSIANLVQFLNDQEEDTSHHYQFIYPANMEYMGTDAISVGLIYRPEILEAQGDAVLLDMPFEEEGDKIQGQRATLIQKLCRLKHTNDCFTVAVNHFKSKRCSGCVDDKGDTKGGMQGCCNNLRVSAAYWLGEYFKATTTANPSDDSILLIGDFNAYAKEDPVYLLSATSIPESEAVKTSSKATIKGSEGRLPLGKLLTEGYGYQPLVTKKNAFSYSYGGELGCLDHALASPSLTKKVSQAFDWRINSLENSLFEYSDKYSGELPKVPNQFSSSDHDPVIIDMRW